jgi:hypothetical protein
MITRISEWRCLYWSYVVFDCLDEDGLTRRDHQLRTRYFTIAWPAHGDHWMPFSERMGMRRAVHLGSVCITRRRVKATLGWGHTVKRFSPRNRTPFYLR